MSFMSALHATPLNNIGLGPPLPYYITINWVTGPGTPGGGYPAGWATNGSIAIMGIINGSSYNTVFSMDKTGIITAITLPTPTTTQFVRYVAYGNGTFVAIGSSWNCVWTSTDGVSWSVTNYTSGTILGQSTYATELVNIVFCNGYFSAIVIGGTSGSYISAMLTSSNGTSWSTTVGGPGLGSDLPAPGLVTNTAQTALFSPDTVAGNYYYYSNSATSFSEHSGIFWQTGYNANYATWIPEISSFAVVGAASSTIGFLPLSNLSTGSGSTVSIGGTGGAGIYTLSNANKYSIVLVAPWTSSSTWFVSFNYGQVWGTTTLPVNPSSTNLVIPFNGKFYLFGNGNNYYIGTPA